MRLPAACVLALVGVCSTQLQAQKAPPNLLELVGAYVQTFLDQLTNVIAEERYSQEATNPRRLRTLRSDFVLVRSAADEWHAFRDVFEVDGAAIEGHREGRLVALFVDPPHDVLRRAQEIANESARLNVHDIGTINNPLMAIAFLQPKYRDRFRFTVGKPERKLGPTVRTIHFEEVRVPTILRLGGNLDLPARGQMWVDETTGRILKTELRVGQRDFVRGSMAWRPPSTVTTQFGVDDGLGIDVPVEMHDKYALDAVDIKGTATYSRFRRFEARPPAGVH